MAPLPPHLQTFAKRYIYYTYGQPLSTGGIIAVSIISLVLFCISIFCCYKRSKYGWGWPYYTRAPTQPQYMYNPSAPNQQGHRVWPGQQGLYQPNNMELNTTEPPPMYTGPGSFYQNGQATVPGAGLNAYGLPRGPGTFTPKSSTAPVVATQ
jgi:hypothetical protein